MADTRRRVKLYALNADRQWDDRGTGHVSSSYVDRLKGISLLVRAESDGSLLLESKILPDTAYQKQQDTLIVWSEGDNFDLALSFQEKAGCDEIWEKICQVQGKDPSVDITQDIVEESEDERFDDMSESAPPVELPQCDIAHLEEINELMGSCLASPMRKEKLASVIENEGYIRKLLNIFRMCEDVENTEGLHYLFEIFKNIFLLNKNVLFETMFGEEIIFDVVGCLEYDPALTIPKKHRQYLKQLARFKEVIPISNPELLAKIHQTYRVQYIQDVVLPTPSVFEDNMLSTLSSFIFFNKVEIVTLIQEDEKFLNELFTQLTDEGTDDQKRRDLVLFLKEFCNFAQNLQPQGKESFYKTLSSLGILQALEITLASEDIATKTASIDILTYIVEFSPSVVRDYTLQQTTTTDDDHQMLLNVVIEQLICDNDPELGGAVQLMGILRILLDPENMLAPVNKSEKTDFLNYFYKHSVHVLIAPLLNNTAQDHPAKEDYQTVQLLGLILELLSFCVEHHNYHIKNCILNKDLLGRILVLMKSTHTFLVLCALRFMRKIIALKDEFYNRYIIKGNLFAPVVDAFVRNNGRYNLLDSAILEMFEFIKLEDIKSLCSHVVENFGKVFDAIEYVQTFKALKIRYDQQQDKLKDRDRTQLESVPSILRNSRYRRDQRQLDEEEEMWFNGDDDFDDNEAVVPGATTDPVSPNKLDSEMDSIETCDMRPGNLKRKRGIVAATKGLLHVILQPILINYQRCQKWKMIEKKGGSTTTSEGKLLSGLSSATVSGSGSSSTASVKANQSSSLSNSHTNSTGSGVSSATSSNGSSLTESTAVKASPSFKKGLVDYEGDSDDEDEEEDSSSSVTTTPETATSSSSSSSSSSSPPSSFQGIISQCTSVSGPAESATVSDSGDPDTMQPLAKRARLT